jgi:hypothetical protein
MTGKRKQAAPAHRSIRDLLKIDVLTSVRQIVNARMPSGAQA